MSLKIVFTGGGTAGHVAPNIALIPLFKNEGWEIAYIGSAKGIEKAMVQGQDVPFYSISSGKLRRYFSLKNFIDPLRIVLGIFQSTRLLYKIKPDVIFSKGGFVAFPVVVGAWLNQIPIIAHESDMSPGLANRLSFPFITKLCLPLEDSKKYFKNQAKIEVTGTPIRQQLLKGDSAKGLKLCGFDACLPCLLVIGGSLGSHSINRVVRQNIKPLIEKFQIIHICGKGNLDRALEGLKGYCQFEYVDEQLGDLFAAAEVVVSRSGANSLYEILALAKPHVLIPLSSQMSRGDQIQNSRYFKKLGVSVVIQDEALNGEILMQSLLEVMQNKEEIINKIKGLKIESAAQKIVSIIKTHANVSLAVKHNGAN